MQIDKTQANLKKKIHQFDDNKPNFRPIIHRRERETHIKGGVWASINGGVEMKSAGIVELMVRAETQQDGEGVLLPGLIRERTHRSVYLWNVSLLEINILCAMCNDRITPKYCFRKAFKAFNKMAEMWLGARPGSGKASLVSNLAVYSNRRPRRAGCD